MFRSLLCGALFLAAVWTLPSAADAWIHDVNANKIDDRIEAVNTNGFAAAFENGDINQRMVIGAFNGAPVAFAIYVGYDHHPDAADAAALQTQSLSVVKPYLYIDYIRAQATFAQIQAIAAMPGVTRVEAIPMMYPTNHWGARVVRARDSRGLDGVQNYALFPSARQELGLDGYGVVVAVLDTGVNDDVDTVNPSYPGHESLNGKWLGGGEFFAGDPLVNTQLNASMNPQDHGGSSYHATHVAGSAIGTGGQDGFFAGVAPAARLVDCKVLSDAGAGFGSADGIEWCIYNMNNDWGLTGADTVFAGIDVLNLSLGGLTESDGTDAGSQMNNAAVAAGLIVCVASGNDDAIDYMPSPAAADDVITVGASTHQSTFDRSDDTVTSFSNEGPRDDDGDLDDLDEMKPNVVAPGAGIVSADGDFSTAGATYHTLSGTSMATPHVAGVAALLRQAAPSLDGYQVRTILQNTAIHGIPSEKGVRPNDPFGVDSNYNPADGWGEVDVYAAVLEAANSTSGAQVVRFRPVARPNDSEIDVNWWTQREFTIDGYDVYRAPDVSGAPGAFAKINSVIISPTGDAVLVGDDNRDAYTYVDDDPALELGKTYWYRVAWVSGGVPDFQPAAPVAFGEQPRVATAYYTIIHNAIDNDLYIQVGTSQARNPGSSEFFVLGPGAASADSVNTIEPANTGTAAAGYLEHHFSIPFTTADMLQAPLIPPKSGQPWYVAVSEGGYINRAGRVTAFSMFVNDTPGSPSGQLYVTDTATPAVTVETQTTTLWIPEASTTAVELAGLHAEAVADGIRIEVQMAAGRTAAKVAVYRSLTDRFEDRELLEEITSPADDRVEFVDRTTESGVRYWYWIELTDFDGSRTMGGPLAATGRTGGLAVLLPAAPNPTRGNTTFRYTLAEAPGGVTPVEMTVHDVRGRLVRVLESGDRVSGDHVVNWDSNDENGTRVASGIYYVRFRAGSTVRTSKVSVIR